MGSLASAGALALTALLVLTFGGRGDQQEKAADHPDASTSEGSQDLATATTSPGAGEPAFGPPQTCTELLNRGWTAPETEPNINFDAESGLAEVTFTEPEDTIVVDLSHDYACDKLPDVGPLLARTRANNAQALREFCADLVAKLNAGELPDSEGMTADPNGPRAYVRTDCPEDLVAELEDATR